MKNSTTKSIIINAFYSFVKAFMSLIFPLVTFPYASRILLSEGIGIVDFSNSVISFCIIIAELGIGKYAIREVAKRKNNPNELSDLVKELFILNLISTLISYLILFISVLSLPKLYEYKELLLLSSIKILFMTIGVEWFYIGIEEFKYITIRSFIIQVLSLVYLFVFVKEPDDIYQYAFFTIFSYLGSYFLNFIHLRKYLQFHNNSKLHPFSHIKYILPFFGMTLISSLYSILDKTMLGFLSTSNQVGYYAAAQKMNNLVIGLVISIGAVFLPRLTVYYKHGELDDFNQLTKQGINIITLICLPMTIGLIFLAKPVILLICGYDFEPAIDIMKFLVPVIFLISISNLIGTQIFPAINKEKLTMFSYGIAAISNIVFNAFLIPKMGATGAAISTLIAETLVLIIQIIFIWKLILCKEIVINFLQSLFASLIMGFVVYLIVRKFDSLIISILLSFISGVICYSILLLILRNKTYISVAKKILKK